MAKRKSYSIADDEKLREEIVNAIAKAATERENNASINIGVEAPSNIWDLGTNMYNDGTDHLPSTWVNSTCPLDLHLRQAPTLNIYKALVEQIQAAILQSMPDIEFTVETDKVKEAKTVEDTMIDHVADAIDSINNPGMTAYPADTPPIDNLGASFSPAMEMPTEEPEIPDIAEILNQAWRNYAERSRMLGELDLCIAHNCNYGSGWLGLHRNALDEDYLRAVHPQLVVCDPVAERPQDIMWVAKVFVTPYAGPGLVKPLRFQMSDASVWPKSVLDHPESAEVRMECFIRKGAHFAGRHWKDAGIRFVLHGPGQLVEEEAWHHKFVPIVPVYLLPSDRLVGHALSSMLWQSQVRVDKILAVILARTSRAAGEKYRLSQAPMRPGSAGFNATDNVEAKLAKPGVQVIISECELQQIEPDHVPNDLLMLLKEEISSMERLAGISQPFQGIAPRGITAGVALQNLATMSSRRVNRMATHLADALRHLGNVWAGVELAKHGIDLPDNLRVKVSLAVHEEQTRVTQFQAITQLLQSGAQLPHAVLIDLIPGLSQDRRKELLTLMRGEQMNAEVARRPGLPSPNEAEESMGDPTRGMDLPVDESMMGMEMPPSSMPTIP